VDQELTERCFSVFVLRGTCFCLAGAAHFHTGNDEALVETEGFFFVCVVWGLICVFLVL